MRILTLTPVNVRSSVKLTTKELYSNGTNVKSTDSAENIKGLTKSKFSLKEQLVSHWPAFERCCLNFVRR